MIQVVPGNRRAMRRGLFSFDTMTGETEVRPQERHLRGNPGVSNREAAAFSRDLGGSLTAVGRVQSRLDQDWSGRFKCPSGLRFLESTVQHKKSWCFYLLWTLQCWGEVAAATVI